MTELAAPSNLLDQFTRNGGLTDPNVTYDQLAAVGVMLADIRKKVQFAMGDWLMVMEERFPEKFSQAAELLEVSEGGLMEYIRVARRVPRSVRKPSLTWSHHRAVAALEVPAQKEWLARAEEQHLSHHQLRDALRVVPEEPPTDCRCCGRPLP